MLTRKKKVFFKEATIIMPPNYEDLNLPHSERVSSQTVFPSIGFHAILSNAVRMATTRADN